ncbi:RNA polymerase subunit sigma [Burkholderia plantarii]|uniref:RNA polymerase subunit sigma n=1 Tax=Burkholderia plantarii TaxID=41899 RepID=UPI0018DDF134|nr:RNA polymerase subunit sigma [Burkholderia plantarii]MBI0325908.1 RNA polymerase subunit sigma [Burkholderia plantarii]
MTDPFLPFSAGTQPVALRASATLRVALAAFVVLCATAVAAGAAALPGRFMDQTGATLVGMLSGAYLASVARRTSASRVPAALRIEAGSGALAVFDRGGRRVAFGPVVGCTQWADRLLVLAVARERGRPVPFVVPADALDARAFRALSVYGRQATHG